MSYKDMPDKAEEARRDAGLLLQLLQ